MTATLAELRERYLRAQLAGDRSEAVRVLVEDGLTAGASVGELQHAVVAAAQQEIGRLWQLNLVTVAQEHMATAISQLALAALFERAPVGAALGKRVVIACVEGELHDLPARLASDALELAGFDVQFLGANIAVADLVAHVREERPALLGLSVTMSFHLPALRRAVEAVRSLSDVPIFVGGHALTWSPTLGRELGVAVVAGADESVVGTALRLTGMGAAAAAVAGA